MPQPLTIPTGAPVLCPTDALIDAITGSTRQQLEGQPIPVIHAVLCAQLRGLGLQPNEAKVRRIAAWINTADATFPPLDAA